ncbi:MAG: SRPBCC domain-containing protein [Acidobacteria bacterium]|nr:SRPBCC domain-containing protein [Acidobacteriota bacterium]
MDKIVHLSVRLRCDARRAFEMFTVNHLLESWLVNVAEVEPVVGGRYELFWEPEERENNSTIGCCVTAVEADKLISFEWRSPKQFKHFANQADPLTHVVVSFLASDEMTEVHLIHTGWRSSLEWEEARQWQAGAWGLAFKELERRVNKPEREYPLFHAILLWCGGNRSGVEISHRKREGEPAHSIWNREEEPGVYPLP